MKINNCKHPEEEHKAYMWVNPLGEKFYVIDCEACLTPLVFEKI